MSEAAGVRRRGSYGIDAPYLLVGPAVLVVVGIVQGVLSASRWPFVGVALVIFYTGIGAYASRRGKFVVWTRLLDQLGLEGDEDILDLGCGRGAVLLLAARHLTTGKAVGVDLWRKGDQSGNGIEATSRNAAAEGVGDRVELHTSDMRSLPFEDCSFDVVLSNVAIHNVKGKADRDHAIDEAARVLRPGGRLLIADLRSTNQYSRRVADLGLTDVDRRNLGWRMWWSGPWLPTHLVSASKPSRSPDDP